MNYRTAPSLRVIIAFVLTIAFSISDPRRLSATDVLSETTDEVGKLDFTQFAATAAASHVCQVQRLGFETCYARADLIFLSREAESYDLAFSILGGTTEPVSLDHGFAPGVRATIGIRTGTTGHFQISYLGINDWSADNRTSNVPFGGSTLDSDDAYSANLNDLEFNLVAMDPYADWDWLFGFRLVDQRDEFGSLLTLDDGLGNPNSIQAERIDAEAINTLFGLQIGTRYGHRFGPLGFDGGVKVGVFNNFISQSGIIVVNQIVVDGVPEPTFSTDDEQVSFMGDFQLRLTYQATSNASMQLGYQGLVFSNIAQSLLQEGGPSSPAELGYHGLFCGLEWRH
ncbi:MAG: BBP7 family outer membrane beta-barrel protein [Pirellulaceae bacterium]